MYGTSTLPSTTFFFYVTAPASSPGWVSDVERLWEGLNHSWGRVPFFCLPPVTLTVVSASFLHIWQADTKALFYLCSSSCGWHFIQVEKHAVSDTLPLMNRGSQYIHEISSRGREVVIRARNILRTSRFSSSVDYCGGLLSCLPK